MVVSKAMRTVLCELYFRVSFSLSGDQGAVVVEGMLEVVVQVYTQVCVLDRGLGNITDSWQHA